LICGCAHFFFSLLPVGIPEYEGDDVEGEEGEGEATGEDSDAEEGGTWFPASHLFSFFFQTANSHFL